MHQETDDKPFGDKTFGEALIASMEEALAYKRGEMPLRTRLVERTAREVRVDAPPDYDSARIRAVRARLAVSQPVFAAALNVSPGTVKAWERGARAGRPHSPVAGNCRGAPRSLPGESARVSG
jgi:DNA-binding transcriptional regulator YiaG